METANKEIIEKKVYEEGKKHDEYASKGGDLGKVTITADDLIEIKSLLSGN